MDTSQQMPCEGDIGRAICWFVEWAERYCSLIESPNALALREFVCEVSVTLSALYMGMYWFPRGGH